MEFIGIKEIRMDGFKLLGIHGAKDMTTANTSYSKMPSKYNGGIFLETRF